MATNRRDNSPPVEGSAGAVPPPHAPRETTQPLQPGAVKDMLAKAIANEKELKPLHFGPGPTPAQIPTKPSPVIQPRPVDPTAPPRPASLKPSDAVPGDPVPVDAGPADRVDSTASAADPAGPDTRVPTPTDTPDTPEALSAEFLKEHPAASNTDTPARGIPKVQPPDKAITGGFGHEPSQYFALDGTEVRAVAEKLLDSIRDQMAHDLRFGIACCYPQVLITATITITGSGHEAPTNDVDHTVTAENTVALRPTTETLLTLTAFAVDDDQTPADALRDKAGLKKPRKQLVTTSMGKTFADVRE